MPPFKMTTPLLSLLLLVLVCLSSSLCFFGQADKITSLPGYNGPPLSMYSGYITLDAAKQRNMFYWLVESQGNPSTDPLVVWFQGGPGCSGLGGLFGENGPFVPDGNGGLQYVDISWTQLANVLYIESPIGVGFSYSDDPLDYITDDNKTAQNSYQFLQGFLEEFPQYQGRDLWFTGESYGGVYVPTLTNLVVSDSSSSINQQFKGFMIGNPVFSCESLHETSVQMNLLYWHGLVSYKNYNQWVENDCDTRSNTIPCLSAYEGAIRGIGEIYQELIVIPPTNQLKKSSIRATPTANDNFPSLDPDDIFQDFCTDNATLSYSENIPSQCNPSGDQLDTYLNRGDVQQAIHAKKPKRPWSGCSSGITYIQNAGSMIPYYRRIFDLKPEVLILVYSGDVDIMTVPFAQTQVCLAELNDDSNPPQITWQPWFVNGATAGYVESFKNYTYATVKGAGHEAPGYQPLTSYNMFQRFLLHQNLLNVSTTEEQMQRAEQVRERSANSLSQSDVLRSVLPKF